MGRVKYDVIFRRVCQLAIPVNVRQLQFLVKFVRMQHWWRNLLSMIALSCLVVTFKGTLVCLCSMTLTMSGPDLLQEQLRRDPQFLQQFYLNAQMEMNNRLQSYGIAMVIDKQSSKLGFVFLMSL